MWVKLFVGGVMSACNFILEISCTVFFYQKALHTKLDLHPTVEAEATKVEFVKLFEDTKKIEEVLELIPVVEGVSEDTNLAGI
jgi:hypothetical protein